MGSAGPVKRVKEKIWFGGASTNAGRKRIHRLAPRNATPTLHAPPPPPTPTRGALAAATALSLLSPIPSLHATIAFRKVSSSVHM
uniref:Uncharacterized protein n=1 Tax=Oryza meridionalis TaxID=40149 RepID=A0A0E0F8P7_9ORYZ